MPEQRSNQVVISTTVSRITEVSGARMVMAAIHEEDPDWISVDVLNKRDGEWRGRSVTLNRDEIEELLDQFGEDPEPDEEPDANNPPRKRQGGE